MPSHGFIRENYYLSQAADSAVSPRLIRVAHETMLEGSYADRPVHPNQTLYLVLEGQGHYRFADRDWDLKRGDLFAISPGEVFECFCDESHTMTYVIFAFASGGQELVTQYLGQSTIRFRLPGIGALEQTLKLILNAARNQAPELHEICRAGVMLFLAQARSARLSASPPQLQAEATFSRCRAYVDHTILDCLSVGEIAKACGIDRSYMGRLFKRYARCSIQAYMIRLRMNIACDRLLESTTPIKQIAHDLGFADCYSFAKAFKRVIGTPPGAYRSKLCHLAKLEV